MSTTANTVKAAKKQFTQATAINAKPSEKAHKLSDRDGLYLLVSPSGGKLWRFDYRFNGKRKTLSIGPFPDVGLADARDRLLSARKSLANGIDPLAARGEAKRAAVKAAAAKVDTFSVVGEEWRARKNTAWAPATSRKVTAGLNIENYQVYSIKRGDSIRSLASIAETRGLIA